MAVSKYNYSSERLLNTQHTVQLNQGVVLNIIFINIAFINVYYFSVIYCYWLSINV